MQLLTLGTSHGCPEADRFCTATLLKVGERLYLIDCGAPVDALMRRNGLAYSALQAVFITHMHGDHVRDLPALFCTYTAVRETQGSFLVYLPEEQAIAPLKAWCAATHTRGSRLERMDARAYSAGLVYDDGVITVEAVPTEHIAYAGAPSYAFVITAEGKRLLFTGDLTEDAHDFPAVAFHEDFDLIVSELTHFTPANAVALLGCCRTKRMIFHHVRPFTADEMRPLLPQLPFSVTVAGDGDVFTL